MTTTVHTLQTARARQAALIEQVRVWQCLALLIGIIALVFMYYALTLLALRHIQLAPCVTPMSLPECATGTLIYRPASEGVYDVSCSAEKGTP